MRQELIRENDTIRSKVEADITPVAMLNRWLRSIPPKEREFFKDCKILSFVPVYMPKGLFDEGVHAYNMDPDQLDWFIKTQEDFRAVEKNDL